MSKVIYIAHILRGNPAEYETQYCFSMCVNEFMQGYNGQFKNGCWVENASLNGNEINDDVEYTIEEYESGVSPPDVVIELIKWLDFHGYWAPWMKDLSRIAILKRFVGSASI